MGTTTSTLTITNLPDLDSRKRVIEMVNRTMAYIEAEGTEPRPTLLEVQVAAATVEGMLAQPVFDPVELVELLAIMAASLRQAPTLAAMIPVMGRLAGESVN